MEKQAKQLKNKLNDKVKELRKSKQRLNRSYELCQEVRILLANIDLDDIEEGSETYNYMSRGKHYLESILDDIEESKRSLS